MNCLICEHKSTPKIALTRQVIRRRLSEYFKTCVDKNVIIRDYQLFKCNNCSFEFSSPTTEGSESFYNWITSQPLYYPTNRWEFGKTIELLKIEKPDGNLLDVGCGDGRFLDMVSRSQIDMELFGLEPTEASAQKCVEKGYRVFSTTLKNLLTRKEKESFDYITLYHVLEHIGDPKKFISDLFKILNKDGKIFISTPLSPMSFEIDWFDILNHPPHHLTRWNLSAYKQLAKELKCDIKVYTESNVSLFRQILNSFKLSIFGPKKSISTKKLLFKMIQRPFKSLKHVYSALIREKINGKRAGDVILVSLSKKNESE